MGARIDMENRQDKFEMQIKEMQGQMKELEEVVTELSMALMQTKQVKSVDLHDDDFTPPAGKRKKAVKKTKVTEEV